MAVLLSGCIGQKPQPDVVVTPPAVLVDYQRSGSIAALNTHLVIFDNGVGVISSRSVNMEINLSPNDLKRITVLFSNAQFSMLDTNYLAPHGGADLMSYTVMYHGKTVTVQDTAIPPSLQPALDELNRIVNSAGAVKTPGSLPSIRI